MSRKHIFLRRKKSNKIIRVCGDIFFSFRNNKHKLHRVEKPAYIHYIKEHNVYRVYEEIWMIHGKLHRVGGPAYKGKSYEMWYQNGLRHRIDGPAVVWFFGCKEWWISGKPFSSKEEWFEALKEEDQLAYLLKWNKND